jgi:hypothetical protein
MKHLISILIFTILVSCGGQKEVSSGNEKNESTQNQIASSNQESASKNETIKDAENISQKTESSEDKSHGPSQDELNYIKSQKTSNTSINYKLEIIEVTRECQDCGKRERNTFIQFPDLDFAKYGKEEQTKKLWKKHKSDVEEEIFGGGLLNHGATRRMGSILSGMETCKATRKSHDWYSDRKSTFLNKTFKIRP